MDELAFVRADLQLCYRVLQSLLQQQEILTQLALLLKERIEEREAQLNRVSPEDVRYFPHLPSKRK